MSQCICGGPLISCRIGILDKDVLQGIVCYKQWCAKCGNSRLTDDGKVLYYNIRTDGYFTLDPLQFWTPASVSFADKRDFLRIVLKKADERKFEGKIDLTMDEIRKAYREGF